MPHAKISRILEFGFPYMLFPGLIYLKALDRPRLGGIGNSYIDTYIDFLAREYTHLSLIPGLYDRLRDRRFPDISSEIPY